MSTNIISEYYVQRFTMQSFNLHVLLHLSFMNTTKS